MNRTSFIGAAGTAVLAAGASPVLAQGQRASDENIRQARAAVAGFIAELQTERADYGGHRVAAISDYQSALTELTAALEARDAQMPGQRTSDRVLRNVQAQTNSLIGQLRDDRADYAGHKGKAMADLQAAVDALSAALAAE